MWVGNSVSRDEIVIPHVSGVGNARPGDPGNVVTGNPYVSGDGNGELVARGLLVVVVNPIYVGSGDLLVQAHNTRK